MPKLEDIGKSLQALANKQLLIGVPLDETKREKGDTRVSNAMIGYVHERGSEVQGIPARPHLVPGVLEAKDAIIAGMTQAAMAALRGDTAAIDKGLGTAGEAAEISVKKKIQQTLRPQIQPESLLSRVTAKSLREEYQRELREEAFPGIRSPVERAQLARRHGLTLIELARATVSSVQPLLDTSDYLNSIRYVIRDK